MYEKNTNVLKKTYKCMRGRTDIIHSGPLTYIHSPFTHIHSPFTHIHSPFTYLYIHTYIHSLFTYIHSPFKYIHSPFTYIYILLSRTNSLFTCLYFHSRAYTCRYIILYIYTYIYMEGRQRLFRPANTWGWCWIINLVVCQHRSSVQEGPEPSLLPETAQVLQCLE